MVSTGSAPAAAARWCSVLSTVFLLTLTACEDSVTDPGDLIPSTLSDAIVDAPRGGKLGCCWLPPMVPQPTFSGTFDPNITNAEVNICALSGSACGTELVTLSMTRPPSITFDLGGETYGVHWRTKSFNLDPSQFYRIRVLVGSLLPGHADMKMVSQSQDLKSVTSDFVGLKDRPLNIKFRIETGLVPSRSPSRSASALSKRETATPARSRRVPAKRAAGGSTRMASSAMAP